VVITIDDLPRGGDGPYDVNSINAMTTQLLQPFSKQKIPVIGFVNAGRHISNDKDLRTILNLWLDAGADLGNHSATHPDINNVSLNTYTADILNGEPVLRDVLKARGKTLEFYRHPFLHTGPTAETKNGLQEFLNQHHYRVAPVTLDNADYAFAALYQKPEFRERAKAEYIPYLESIVEFFERRSIEVVGREIPQILLIHANQLNADLMPDLLAMFQRRGYRFISLSQALKDPAYQLRDDYVGPRGISWLHRWGVAKGMPNKEEPDAPEWVMKALRESN
jgi:peptidoglycan-N-acetylglucosamine deacetylase